MYKDITSKISEIHLTIVQFLKFVSTLSHTVKKHQSAIPQHYHSDKMRIPIFASKYRK